jgi:hypothetical protein
MVYTLQERVQIVGLYYEHGKSARTAARVFNENHPGKNVRHKYVLELLNKLMETGNVNNRKHNRSGIVNDEAINVAVLGHVAMMENTQSLTSLSRESGVSRTTVSRILHRHKFHPYKIKMIHELNEDDFDRRMEYCEILSERVIETPNLLYKICFSDECTFYLNGEVNRQNFRYWSDSNPHLARQVHTQHPQKLNVWAGILGNHIIGPFFLEGNLNGEGYLNLLINHIMPSITNTLELDPLLENEVVFQQDGAPPHYVAPVRQFLNNTFPDRWIGRRGPTEWPPRSPDLTPLDFFLWGWLKSKVYKIQPTTLHDLREEIIRCCRLLTPDILQNVRAETEARLFHCMEVNGAQFEHLIKYFFF